MTVLTGLKTPGHITEVLYHANHANDLIESGVNAVEVAGVLFDCLNKLQSEWFSNRERSREMSGFRQLILGAIPSQQRNIILNSLELNVLANFSLKILNQKTLLDGNYRPGEAIPIDLEKKASEDHHSLKTAFDDIEKQLLPAIDERILKRVANLLYVVRCNIKHGEKTPNGPDHNKVYRDNEVCKIVVPLQLLLIDLLLNRPSTKLIVYGTLAPGESNASQLENLSGNWSQCFVRGKLEIEKNGLKTFSWDPNVPEHEFQLFESDELPEHWHRLEAFEGDGYMRRSTLAKVSGNVCVAYAFVPRPPNHHSHSNLNLKSGYCNQSALHL